MSSTHHTVKESGDRIDHYLASKGICTSRSEAIYLIKAQRISVNHKGIKPSYHVKEGDQILIDWPLVKVTELTPVKVDFDVLYEDKDILVINKPASLVVHPGAGNYENTLVHGLLYHCKDLSGIGGVERPGIVHRLDKGTSGVMVVAKNDRAHQNLSKQFQNHKVKKEYMALCLGQIQRQEDTLIHFMKRAEINRKKFVVTQSKPGATRPNRTKGKEAITHYKVIKQNHRVSLVSIDIQTGRTHQIRVHMSYLGHPIMGDETYGGTKKLKEFDEDEKKYIRGLHRPLLHSKKITFTHPRSAQIMTYETEVPQDFKESIEKYF